MPACRFATIATVLSVLAPGAAHAMDDYIAASSEAKCKRNISNSSTAKLFPARPSPDIDNLGGSIR